MFWIVARQGLYQIETFKHGLDVIIYEAISLNIFVTLFLNEIPSAYELLYIKSCIDNLELKFYSMISTNYSYLKENIAMLEW